MTCDSGWVMSAYVDHDPAEAWAHVAKTGDRFAALQPVYDAVVDRWGRLDADVARGLALRHDWGPSTARPTSPARWSAVRKPRISRTAGLQARPYHF